MQKFTRPLTREVDIGGERIALTLAQEGVTFRLVGTRKPPYEISWAKLLCAATRTAGAEAGEPSAGELAAAVAAVKKGAPPQPSGQAAATPVSSSPSSGDLAGLLDRLGKWLAQHRPDFLGGLRPGASPEELDTFQARLGVAVPAGLRTLLAWHNGQKEDSLGGFEQDWRLMSTTQIARARRELLASPPSEGAGAAWQPAWLPVFEDGNGAYLFLDTSQATPPLRAYWVGQPAADIVAPSLEAWFQYFVPAVEQGQYHEEAERGTFFRQR